MTKTKASVSESYMADLLSEVSLLWCIDEPDKLKALGGDGHRQH